MPLMNSNGDRILQPCDTSFNAPLSHYFGEEVTWLQKLQIKVTMYNLFSVFGKAFIRTAKMETAINAFKSTGIYPCNKEMFLIKHFNSVDENCMSSKHSKDPDENVENFINIIKEITGGTNKVDVVKCNRDSLSNTEINITNQNSKNINNIDINVTKDNTVNINDSELSIPRCDAENTNSIDINIIDNINNSEISNTISNLQINNHGSESSNQHSEITIPFDYVLQAAPLIHHLSNSLRTYSNVTENIPIVPKNKRQKKGKAAIITSDEYHKDLITEKTKNIKKEKNNDTVKKVKGKKNDKIPNSPTVQLRKRPHSIEEMVVAKRKPLVALNTNSNHSNTVLHTSLENCPSFNNPSLSAYNTLQMSNFSESFINLLPIEIIP